MSTQGGGDISELLRQLGADALVHEAERAGLRGGGPNRMRCPWRGCEKKGPERKFNAAISPKNGHWRVFCHACNESGDLVDLLQRTRGFSKEEALAHVRGVPVPERSRPELRVVGGARAELPADKMESAEVRRLWDSLAVEDPEARRYLATRNLEEAVDAGFVRFARIDHPDRRIKGRAGQGYLIAALTTDVVNQPRGIQLRLARPARNSSEVSIVSVKGSVTATAYFGEPGLIEVSPLICVTEGLGDTLAVRLWAGERAIVVGAAGKGALPKLAAELEGAGVDLHGRLFVLFPQNDDPQELKSTSRSDFTRLSQLLLQQGAEVCVVKTPAEHGDVAEWLQRQPETAWPPPELALALDGAPGADQERVTVITDGHALPARAQYTTEHYAQNLTTLAAILDDPAQRAAVLLRKGELSFDAMTHSILVDGVPLADKELTKVRIELERIARSTDGKPLQFKPQDIRDVLTMLASRREVHPLHDEVAALKWDGKKRIETELALQMGHEEYGFDARLLFRWFISAIARAMEPGCKVDTVLILKGGGGIGKTKFFEALGGSRYTGSSVTPGDKDGLLVLRRFWIVEWGELDDMKRSRNMAATKRFLSLRRDDFRDPYGRDVASSPRHCVIVGTTNEQEILPHDDEGGHRRFWPMEIRRELDISWVERHRDQLFAEALAVYKAGLGCPACAADRDKRCGEHRWWLTKDEEEILKTRHGEYETDRHPWFNIVDSWLSWPVNEALSFVTTERVMQEVIGQKTENLTPLDAKAVAAIMKQLGWTKGRANGRTGPRGWLRPGALL